MVAPTTRDDLKQSLSRFKGMEVMRWAKRGEVPELIRKVRGEDMSDAVPSAHRAA